MGLVTVLAAAMVNKLKIKKLKYTKSQCMHVCCIRDNIYKLKKKNKPKKKKCTHMCMDTSGSYGGHRKHLNKYIKRKEKKKKNKHMVPGTFVAAVAVMENIQINIYK